VAGVFAIRLPELSAASNRVAGFLHSLGARRWRWEISPPSCVQGLRRASGEVEGELRDAECAAQNVIEQQTAQYTL